MKTTFEMTSTKTESIRTAKDTAAAFVDRLIDEGSLVRCDDSNEAFKSSFELPKFYDDDLFKRGQQFFHKHIFAMFFSTFTGAVVILSVPTILKILIMTKMSGTSMTAYRRYVATILHVMLWFEEDFKPGSDLWNSIADVRRLHNSASKKGKRCSLNHISQMDMALTQFGFIGFALCRSRTVGIHGATDEEWAGFIHVWRVIGHLLGIEERFNICRKSVEETREICNVVARKVCKPLMEKRDQDSFEMLGYFFDGLWSIFPLLDHWSIMNYTYALLSLDDDSGEVNDEYLPLKGSKKKNFDAANWITKKLEYTCLRIFYNYIIYTILFLASWFPILAIVRFGISNSYVRLRLLHREQLKKDVVRF